MESLINCAGSFSICIISKTFLKREKDPSDNEKEKDTGRWIPDSFSIYAEVKKFLVSLSN